MRLVEKLSEKIAKVFKTTNVMDIIFPVAKLESQYDSNTENEFDIVVYPADKPKGYKVASVADRYNLVDNQIFADLRKKLVSLNVEFEENYEMSDYSVFVGNIVLKKMNGKNLGFSVGENDLVYPKIILRKSYNSRIKYAFMFGFFRLICKNGLTIPVPEMKHFNFNYIGKHTAKLSESISKLELKINEYIDFAENKNIGERFNAMTKNTYIANYGERVEAVMTANKIALGIGNKNLNIVLNTIEMEAKILNSPVNDWLIYNGINSLIYKHNVKTDEVREVMDREVLNYILKTS